MQYRDFLGRVVQGGRCDEYQLSQAVSFFEDLTEIRVGLHMSEFGLILDRPQLREALGKWDEWYSEHAKDIRWDPSLHRYTAGKN